MTTAGTAAKKTFALTLFLFLISLFCLPSSARASCVNPTGNAGDFRYYGGFQTPEYCDGASWVAMGPVGDARTGLVGWWKLDDGSGTSAADSSGNGYTGTLYNAPTWTTGMNNGALTFSSASSQYVSTGNITTPSNVSIAFWANTTSSTANATPFDWGGYCICAMASNGSGKMLCTANFSGNGVISTSPVDDGNWHYFVFTNQPSPLVAQLYVDGVLNSTNTTDTLGGDIGIPQTVYFGQKGDGSQYFSGTIDDVRVYNRVLTAQDVHTLYTSTGPLSGDIQSNLVAWWKFDEASGTTANDSTGTGNSGTLVNTPTWTTSGKINGALSFNAASSQAVTTPLTSWAPGDFTACAWFNSSSDAAGGRILDKGYGNGFWLGHETTGAANQWGGGVWQGSPPYGVFVTLANGSWHHLCGVRSGTTWTIYGDGGAVSASATVPSTALWTNALTVNGNAGAPYFTGTIDDVRLYNRALSQSDVLTLYNTYATACASPVGYAGDLLYNADNHVPQFCNDSSWVPLGPVTGTGGGGCTSPTGSAGDMVYNADKGYMQYCNSTNWIAIGQSYYGPQTGLVGWWKLDETSGTSASDSSGNGNTGTATNTTIVAGQVNNARQFNGTTDYVTVNDSSSLHPGSLTISSWVYVTALQGANAGGEQELLDKRGTSCGAYDMWVKGTSFPLTPRLTVTDSSGDEYIDGGASVPQNTWTNIVGTYDSSSGITSIYVNGRLSGTTTGTHNPSVSPCTNAMILGDAGALVGGPPSVYEMIGKEDDVRIYNRALSASEIWQLYLVTGGQ